MSDSGGDDEERGPRYVKRQKIVHYGSLAEGGHDLRAGPPDGDSPGDHSDHSDNEGGQSNIEVSKEYLPLNQDDIRGEKDDILEEFERRKRARLIHVSTDDAQVKKDLRALGQPICFFGEGPAERRNRLRDLLSQLGEDAIQKRKEAEEARAKEQRKQDETTWYHEGPAALKAARQVLAHFSLPRAQARIGRQKQDIETPESARMARNQEVQKMLKGLDLEASQIADTRPISWCEFSPDSQLLATGSWSGLCKLWSVPDCQEVLTLRGHNDHVGNVVFNPKATIDLPKSGPNLASCDSTGHVNVWSMESSQPLMALPNLESRVSRVAFHPMGLHLAACVYDNSWRMFDLESQEEILHQEGHSKAVH
ncbi:U4/U6 small nuclear ribonucleoprotein Prp4-like [Tigriopus californicus]|uniref:U4/U6 small nuclear ribonucleoprotein Prp4-like n=1 Tax=Tigriopus californicus TaxID=6832 RepID=UPI0027DA9465|nr:U4/U6 small nuclear ribonucleoprotein Prp4-like [Tigriopus californicus]